MFRPLVLAPLLVLGMLVPDGSASAQSAYDYPICAVRGGRNGSMSCYYSSYAQCMATMSGIGGYCVDSPYYRGPRPGTRERRVRRRDW